MKVTPCNKKTRNSKGTARESTHNTAMTAHDLSVYFGGAAISLPESFGVMLGIKSPAEQEETPFAATPSRDLLYKKYVENIKMAKFKAV